MSSGQGRPDLIVAACKEALCTQASAQPLWLVSLHPTHYPAFQCRVWGLGRVVQPQG